MSVNKIHILAMCVTSLLFSAWTLRADWTLPTGGYPDDARGVEISQVNRVQYNGYPAWCSVRCSSDLESMMKNETGGRMKIPRWESDYWGDVCPVRLIDDEGFRGCDSIKSIIIQDGLEGIGSFAFAGCKSLTTVSILQPSIDYDKPHTLTNIESCAFFDCPLEKIFVSGSGMVDSIKGMFEQASGIVSASGVAPDLNAEVIPAYQIVFENMGGEFSSPEITRIRAYNEGGALGELPTVARSGYKFVGWFTAPEGGGGVQVFPETVGSALSSRYKITLYAHYIVLPEFDVENGVLLQYNGEEKNVVIPHGVWSVGKQAFLNRTLVEEVVFPSGLSSIGEWAFSSCRNLYAITLPRSLKSIGDGAFTDSVIYPQHCPVKYVFCEGDVERIKELFLETQRGVEDVKFIALDAVESKAGIRWISDKGDGVCSISAGAGFWAEKSGKKAVEIPETINGRTVVGISAGAFSNCGGIETIKIPSGVRTIGTDAFAGCASLKKIYVDEGMLQMIRGMLAESGLDVTRIEFIEGEGHTISISDVKIFSGRPWKDVVIGYKITGSTGKWIDGLQVTASDNVSGKTYVCKTLEGVDFAPGDHVIKWDASADGVKFKSDDVIFKVRIMPRSASYYVIDLSGGTAAKSYPVTELAAMPSGGWTDEYKTTKLVLRRIDPGSFKMLNKYDVTLTQPFYMGVFEVTQKQYELVMGSSPSHEKGDMRPVAQVSYNAIRGSSAGAGWPTDNAVDATSFLGKLRAKTGLSFDLPTDAQWEYACRAGTTSDYNNGGSTENDLKRVGRYSGNRKDGKGGYTDTYTTVGSYQPNAWGFYDMHGNVAEWCLDWYGSLAVATDPKGASSGSDRVFRGGCWYSKASECYSSCRDRVGPSYVNDNYSVGFRLARTLQNGDGKVDGTDVIAAASSGKSEVDTMFVDGITVEGTFSFAYGSVGATYCCVAANGVEIVRGTEAGIGTWVPTVAGENLLVYSCDGITMESMIVATGMSGTITYENLHGTTHANPNSYLESSSFVFTPPTVRTGYKFIGWTPAAITADMTGAQTVTAGWRANTYKIVYDSIGGTGATAATECEYDKESEIAANGFTRVGYVFKGWATEENGEVVYEPGEKVVNLSSVDDGEVRLYAVWASECLIDNVDVFSGYPWKEVAIKYEITRDANLPMMLSITAKDNVSGKTYECKTLEGVDLAQGIHVIKWNAAADGAKFKSDDVVFTVRIEPAEENPAEHLYSVIDLSGGRNAKSYPVTGLDDVPSGGWTDAYKTTKLVLRRIDAGAFRGRDWYYNTRTYDVTLTKPFYIGVFEVTQRQYELVMGKNPSYYTGGMRPVEMVSYDMIRGSSAGACWPTTNTVDDSSFFGVLRAKTGLDFDLPTDAQWEYACRAGTVSEYNNGGSSESDLKTLGRYYGNRDDGAGSYGDAHTTVGSYLPNAWGLYDMHGNVYEWCLDWSGSPAGGVDPDGGGAGSSWRRAIRGGAWSQDANYCSSAFYGAWAPSDDFYDIGFRTAITLHCAGEEPAEASSEGVSIDTTVEDGWRVSGPISVAYGVIGASECRVTVNGEEIVRATENGREIWVPTTVGECKLIYSCGDITMESTVFIPGICQRIIYENLCGVTHTNPEYYLEGDNVDFKSPTERTGYTFTGWTPVAITADMKGVQTVTAGWRANTYKIVYDPNGGSGTTAATDCEYDKEGEVAANGFTRNGYVFKGWATETNGEVVYEPGAKVKNLTCTAGGEVMLYAVWGKECLIKNIEVFSGYPWEEVVIKYEITDGVSRPMVLEVEARDNVNGTIYECKTLEGVDITQGSHVIKWNASADGAKFKSDDVVFTVRLVPAYYCVLDLAGGPSADSYPMTFLVDAPNGAWADEYKTTKLVLRWIEAGTFKMQNQYDVTLTKPFYIGVFEVTQKQYELVTESNPSQYEGDMRPVECVSYNMIRGASAGAGWPENNAVDAGSFLGKLRAKTGLDFDLPTEAQWEYACRAGTTSDYNNGGSSTADLKVLGRYDGDRYDGKGDYSFYHTTVGSYLPNAWGLYDMHGNVMEWCLDWYEWSGAGSAAADPKGVSTGTYRMLRGGGWYWDATECTSFERFLESPAEVNRYCGDGFRLARTLQGNNNLNDVESVATVDAEVASGSISVDTTFVDGMTVTGALSVAYGAVDALGCIISVDAVEIVNTNDFGIMEWLPTVAGEHKLVYSSGGVEMESSVVLQIPRTITFDPCGGSAVAAVVFADGCPCGELPIPSRPGYEFLGWFTAVDGGTRVTEETLVTSDLILYAHWFGVSDVTVFSGFPWQEVLIGYEIEGRSDRAIDHLEIVAKDNESGKTYECVTLEGAELTTGRHVIKWNASADGVKFASDDVVFTVRIVPPPLYCVIDLSGGASAASYPMTMLADVPKDGWTDEYKTTKLVLRRVEPGTFMMKGLYDVALTKPFYIGVFEVTQKQYELVMGTKPSYYKGDMRPVEYVSYDEIRGSSVGAGWPANNLVDATSFLGKLRARTGLDFDLPTEAQWEYACRAGMESAYNNGGSSEEDLKMLGRYYTNRNDGKGGYSYYHTTVGSYLSNAWGLYDMHGNVEEWCLDWYGGAVLPTDPMGASSGSYRVVRGGSYNDGASKCTSSGGGGIVSLIKPSGCASRYGFRLAGPIQDGNDPTDVEGVGEAIAESVSGAVLVNTVFEDRTNVKGSILVSYGTVSSSDCRVTANEENIVESTENGQESWSPTAVGEYKMAYSCGGVTMESIFVVTEIWQPIAYLNLRETTHTNPATYQEGESITFTPPSGRSGYTFTGWTPAAITADMMGPQAVTAGWRANTYRIVYDANGGSGTMTATDCEYDKEGEIAANGFTRNGYVFKGWATEVNGEVVYEPGAKVTNLTEADGGVVKLYAVWETEAIPMPVANPTIEGDEGATVTGDAETGFVVKPSEGNTSVEVTIPQGVDAAKVTVEVSPKVASVKPNGAKVKIVSGAADITEFLNVPAADGDGVVDLTKATVKEEIVKEAMDVKKGAKIELDAAIPSLTTPNTRMGLLYQLREGVTLDGMKNGDSTIGDGKPWSPEITVKGGNSGFYSIGVGKGE